MDRPPVIIVGAGAAGLMTAIFARRAAPGLPVHILDGSPRPGAKILVSGGSRCNVTNTVVSERDYWGGKRTIIKRVLARLTVAETIAVFAELGVSLKQEPTGKLFPVSDRSRDVLDALLRALRSLDVPLHVSTRVHSVVRDGSGFRLETSRGPRLASAVVLATGGLSLPKTGSDGAGLAFARSFGHSIVPTTPALAPLVVGAEGFHARLSGVAQDVELVLRSEGRVAQRIRGPMLWTHFGTSGPAALDMSRHWLRERLEGHDASLVVNVTPGQSYESVDARLTEAGRSQPRATVQSVLSAAMPDSVAASLLTHASVDGSTRMADLAREGRRALAHALTALPLPVSDSRGYNYAEATAGGVSLDEVDAATMESRRCQGLFFVGEMLDVDGRLGGFNFQWAWASARTAGEALARRHAGDAPAR